MSRSQGLLGGQLPDAAVGSELERRYFARSVPRVALCTIAGTELGINPGEKANRPYMGFEHPRPYKYTLTGLPLKGLLQTLDNP